MQTALRLVTAIALVSASAACGRMEQSSRARAGDGAVIFQSTILTMDERRPSAEAVIVKDGVIVDVGPIDDLVQAYPGAGFDERFLRRFILPAFVDARSNPDIDDLVFFGCPKSLDGRDANYSTAIEVNADRHLRLVAQGRAGIAAVIKIVKSLPEDGAGRRVIVEIVGPLEPAAARLLASTGRPLVLVGSPPTQDCGDEASDGASFSDEDRFISGLIAVTPATGSSSYLEAAARYLGPAGPVRLTLREALEAITIDAATTIGAETNSGSIAPGKRAAFAVLDRNPLATPAEAWGAIAFETVDLSPAE